MEKLTSEAALRDIYGQANKAVREKTFPHLDKHSRHYLALCPFFTIGTSHEGGLADVSPRGGEPGFVHALDDTHIAFADRPGNNRLDTLVNLVHNPAVGMLFFLPGIDDMMRINGLASITVDPALMERFVHDGKAPRSVVVIETLEVYFHCSKALRRSDLWNADKHIPRKDFPTLGKIAKDQFRLPIPAKVIDMALGHDAKKNLY